MKSSPIYADATKAELREAIERYQRQRAGLGREFLTEFGAALERVREAPCLYAAEEESGTHFCPLRRFRYTLVYAARTSALHLPSDLL